MTKPTYSELHSLLVEVVGALTPFSKRNKVTGVWEHGDGCPAEDDLASNPACTCGAWHDIDRANNALAHPLIQEILKEGK